MEFDGDILWDLICVNIRIYLFMYIFIYVYI